MTLYGAFPDRNPGSHSFKLIYNGESFVQRLKRNMKSLYDVFISKERHRAP